jgi:hypothetical protein
MGNKENCKQSYEMSLSELTNKQTPLDVVTAIIYYSEVKKLTEIPMLNFLEEKKKEGKDPKFFKELSLPGISGFSTDLGRSGFLYVSISDATHHNGFHVDRTPEVKKVMLKRIKEVFNFKERLALRKLGEQFKERLQEEQGK